LLADILAGGAGLDEFGLVVAFAGQIVAQLLAGGIDALGPPVRRLQFLGLGLALEAGQSNAGGGEVLTQLQALEPALGLAEARRGLAVAGNVAHRSSSRARMALSQPGSL